MFVQHATGYSKLEKADILELAVKYLRNIRGQQISGMTTTFKINVEFFFYAAVFDYLTFCTTREHRVSIFKKRASFFAPCLSNMNRFQ